MSDNNTGPNKPVVSYGSNSMKSQEPAPAEAPRVAGPVISEAAIERKEPLRKKFLHAYAGDSAQSVGQHLLMEVVVPGTKAIISDIVTQGINRLLYGNSRPSQGVRSGVGGGSYGRFFNGGGNTQSSSQQNTQGPQVRQVQTPAFGEMILQTRGDAEIVLESLRELIEQYGNAKVSDLYSLVGLTGKFTDQSIGWNNLSRASVSAVREGYLLDLPNPGPIR